MILQDFWHEKTLPTSEDDEEKREVMSEKSYVEKAQDGWE
jgi:hypothetical protein